MRLSRDGVGVSSLDLVDGGFTLFAGSEARAWSEAAASASHDAGVACAVYQVGRAVTDPDGALCEGVGISPSGAVLVRPDDVVGWRATGAETGAPATMARVFAAMLGRTAVAGGAAHG